MIQKHFRLSVLLITLFLTTIGNSKAQDIVIATCDAVYRADTEIQFSVQNADTTVQSILWNFDDGTPAGANTEVVNHTYTVPGNYTVSMTITYVDNSSEIITKNIVIGQSLFTVTVTNCSNNITLGQPISFETLAATGLSSTEWTWGDGTTNITSSNLTSHTYQSPNIYTITAKRTFDNGCVSIGETRIGPFNGFRISASQVTCQANGLTQGMDVDYTTSYTGTQVLDYVVWTSQDSIRERRDTPNYNYTRSLQENETIGLIRYFDNGACIDTSFIDMVIQNNLISTTAANERCTERDISFQYTGVTEIINSIQWEWDDGTSQTGTETSITKYYDTRALDTLVTTITYNSTCTDVVTQYIKIYGKPVISAFRDYENFEPYCLNSPEVLRFEYKEPLSPDISVDVDFGDGYTQTYTYDDIIAGRFEYKYTKSSCGENAVIKDRIICEDCFVIMMFATNHCSIDPSLGIALPSLSFATPVPVKIASPPAVDFNFSEDDIALAPDGNYYTCLNSTLTENNTIRGVGPDCTNSVDTFTWDFQEVATGNFLPGVEVIDTVGTDTTLVSYTFPTKGEYKIYLSQQNACGSDTATAIINIRDEPEATFQVDRIYDCYPADITFINTSETSTVESNWYFVSDPDNARDTTKITVLAGDTVALEDVQELYIDEGAFQIILEIKDAFKCTNQTDTTLHFDQLCEDLYVPNAFIPDSPDPELKVFKPVAINLIKYSMEIFDLHGKLLWRTTELMNGEPAEAWDGTFRDEKCPQGTYVWKIKATLDDGYTEDGIPWKGQDIDSKKKRTVGTISLIR